MFPTLNATKRLLALALIFSALTLQAQTNGSNSPYSRYGFGLLSDRAQGFNKGMAGLAYGMQNGQELNVKNPASYAHIDSLSFLFDVGFSLQNANLNQNGQKINAHNTSYDYLSMGFRVSPGVGVSLGLMPFSTIGYSLSNTYKVNNQSDLTQTDTYSGDGGVHEVYAGVGWAPVKGLSLGVNAGYLWGDMTHTVLASFNQTSVASRRRQYVADIRTYKLDIGLQYNGKIGRKNAFVLGLTYGLGHDINSKASYYDQTIANNTVSGDTISNRHAYALPHTFGAGLVWAYGNSLRVGVDYSLQKWADVKSPTLTYRPDGRPDYVGQKGAYTDMTKIAFGAEYVADPTGLRWSQRVRYRLGFSYTSPYTKVDGVDGPKDWLVSAGVGLPIINSYNNRSILNLSVQYERVKPKVAGMITENYLRLCIGLSFNERWFMKWKVD